MSIRAGLVAIFVGWAALPSAAGADAIGDNNICYSKFATGDYKSAIDFCTRAIDSGDLSEPDLIAALINRGVAYKSTGDYESAIDDYTRALRIAPKDALLYQNRANALREMGDYDAAREDIEKSIELDPKSAGAWYVRGAIAEARGNHGGARGFYMTALGLDPENQAYRDKILGRDAR
ncbi:tetratricopeptide repeat protein [Parvibaculum sp.]|jgi:tetratricopeptide (TPR) repeat protein|uniref:tetratricopeptide repeat protein n=2 Tax=Parvibaculum sp. TaxID=2024848 RepID=UPI001B2D8DBB|nr:tetratricopeptide repeat protein [Parvibaculum sp.]MBO6678877.1 tetratricopeptide repeat protein [Parvibaculum sp.]MBO6685795.1 tetratricopeptide repeat protein [Parvibaculum sp.]MBO6903385.1 tetratricopeptide repeat protein [Parvibaculum sp.]